MGWTRVVSVILVAAAGLVTACSAPTRSSRGPEGTPNIPSHAEHDGEGGGYKVGRSYVANGERYTPRVNYDYEETGIASWYGDEFAGRRTANGEVFDPTKLTAAHRTLPLPSIVRVTNLENGRTVRVRVNDRGPFARDRIIDVSRRAAKLLGFKNAGTARVRVQILEQPSRRVAQAAKARKQDDGQAPTIGSAVEPTGTETHAEDSESTANGRANPPSSDASDAVTPNEQRTKATDEDQRTVTAADWRAASRKPTGYNGEAFVQAGAFVREENARSILRRLEHLGEPFIQEAVVDGTRFYRVRFGPIADQRTVDQLLAQLADEGVPTAAVVMR